MSDPTFCASGCAGPAVSAAQDRNALLLLAAVLSLLALSAAVALWRSRRRRDGDPDFWGGDATPFHLEVFGMLSAFGESRAQEARRRRDLVRLREAEQEKARLRAARAEDLRAEAEAVITRLGEELAAAPHATTGGSADLEGFLDAYEALKARSAEADGIEDVEEHRAAALRALEDLRAWSASQRRPTEPGEQN